MIKIFPNKQISFTKACNMLAHASIIYIKSLKLFKPYLHNTVTIYGSAKSKTFYKETQELGKTLSNNGFNVMTGAGPGLMEAANKGAKQGSSASLGCAIKTNYEKGCNQFLDKEITCKYFFIRKVILTRFSCAFIAAPGGYGTLDEIFEILNLIVTNKIRNYPVILFGIDYWSPILDFLRNQAINAGTINTEALNYIYISDDPNEICKKIKQCLT